MNFSTERLILHQLSLEETDFIFNLLNNPGWIKFIGDRNIHNIAAAIDYINKINSNPDFQYWAVKLKTDLTSIGIITFIKRNYLDHHDIGFAFLPQYEKNGYAFEASSVVLKSMLATHSTILATTIKSNTRSIKLLEKLGLSFDREIQQGNDKLQIYAIHH
jgi:[ribosomal protein S5]-alanine N-acetyltransferase